MNYEVGAKHQFLPTAAVNLDVLRARTSTTTRPRRTFNAPQGTSLVRRLRLPERPLRALEGLRGRAREAAQQLLVGQAQLHVPADARARAATPTSRRSSQEGGGNAAETRLSEMFVSWNRPHKLSANFDLRFDDAGAERLGWAKHGGSTSSSRASRDAPYTPIDVHGIDRSASRTRRTRRSRSRPT